MKITKEEKKSQNFWPKIILKIDDFSLFAWPWECNGSKRWYATIFSFFVLLSHQLLYFHLKVKNSDRAETEILTPTIIVALELPFLFFLMTNYRMTWCENMLKILVISTLIIKNFSVSLLYKNRTKFTLLKRSRKAIQAAFLTNGKKSLRAAIC